jgi:hypothetical protein
MSHHGVRIEEIAQLVGHASTRTTGIVYRVRGGADNLRAEHNEGLRAFPLPGRSWDDRRSLDSIWFRFRSRT